MNVVECPHCGALSALDPGERFDGRCECCSQDFYAAPEPVEAPAPYVRMREIVSWIESGERLKARADQSIQVLSVSDIPAEVRDSVISDLRRAQADLTDQKRQLLEEFRSIIEDALDG
ncbi:hypothetical protein ACTXMG_00220 [Corynebacterium flavescens]|uniref:hypothetical protein n=1 Tax=Corynebacterium flavescens TaxID=28028 RepID=UPI003FD516E1